MRKVISSLGLCLGLLAGSMAPAGAVLPVTVSPNSNTEWSRVIYDPFDGPIVYDRNYDTGGSFAFVSSWSKQGIRATYTDCRTDIIGYDPAWRRPWGIGLGFGRGYGGGYGRHWGGWGGWGGYLFPASEPVYRRLCEQHSPRTIRFAINGQQYTYENGMVSPELAIALKSAPTQNLTVRLVWENGATTDVAIGKNTVAAWKTIFNGNSPRQ